MSSNNDCIVFYRSVYMDYGHKFRVGFSRGHILYINKTIILGMKNKVVTLITFFSLKFKS